MLEGAKKTTKNSKKMVGVNKEVGKVNLKVRQVRKPRVVVKKNTKIEKNREKIERGDSVVEERESGFREPATHDQDVEKYINELIRRRREEEKVEKEKVFLLRAGVSFFMILIVLLWGFNMRNTFKTIAAQNSDQDSMAKWNEMSNKLSAQIEEMKVGVQEASDFVKNDRDIQRLKAELMASSTASTTSVTATSTLPVAEVSVASSTEKSGVASGSIEILKASLEKKR